MLNDRVEAEMTYAMRLDRISSERYSKSFQIGTLAEEVQNFKYSCQARARQAGEVSDNVTQDCIQPLKDLLAKHDEEFDKGN